jgi:hypothetical protein
MSKGDDWLAKTVKASEETKRKLEEEKPILWPKGNVIFAQIGDTVVSTAWNSRRPDVVLSNIIKLFKKVGVKVSQVQTRQLLEAINKFVASSGGQEEDDERLSQASILLKLTENLELWHSPDVQAFATILQNGHKEHWQLNSRTFKEWLALQFFNTTGKNPNRQALDDAIETLAGKAKFTSPEYPVFVRVAGTDDKIYLDLGDPEWHAAEITKDGWKVIQDPPVRFRRSKGMLPLPTPEPGGSIDLLRKYSNLPSGTHDDGWVLLVGYIVGAFNPRGPYPIAMHQGEQGSGKTFIVRVVRSLIDPNKALLRACPKEERDLMIAAYNNWVLAFDNVSSLPAWLSDAFCRISTGGGLATRQLYTDTDETILDATRPIILNGIEDFAERDDLRDRAVIITHPPIPEEQRKTEEELWASFQKEAPLILGAILDAVVMALKRYDQVKLGRLPRMADFARWVTAAEPALGWSEGTFLLKYYSNRQEATEARLTDDELAQALIAFARSKEEWTSTATELLEELNSFVNENKRTLSWPKDARGLGNKLRRLAPVLRMIGINVAFSREPGTGRRIILIKSAKSTGENVVTDVTLITPAQNGEKTLKNEGASCDNKGESSDNKNSLMSQGAEECHTPESQKLQEKADFKDEAKSCDNCDIRDNNSRDSSSSDAKKLATDSLENKTIKLCHDCILALKDKIERVAKGEPTYGFCSNCQKYTLVFNVLLKEGGQQ